MFPAMVYVISTDRSLELSSSEPVPMFTAQLQLYQIFHCDVIGITSNVTHYFANAFNSYFKTAYGPCIFSTN